MSMPDGMLEELRAFVDLAKAEGLRRVRGSAFAVSRLEPGQRAAWRFLSRRWPAGEEEQRRRIEECGRRWTFVGRALKGACYVCGKAHRPFCKATTKVFEEGWAGTKAISTAGRAADGGGPKQVRLPALPKPGLVREKTKKWIEKKKKEKKEKQKDEKEQQKAQKKKKKVMQLLRTQKAIRKKKKKKKKTGAEWRRRLRAELEEREKVVRDSGRRPSADWKCRQLRTAMQRAR